MGEALPSWYLIIPRPNKSRTPPWVGRRNFYLALGILHKSVFNGSHIDRVIRALLIITN